MKKYLLFGGIVFLFSSFITFSLTQIVSAFNSGKSSEVAKYFDVTVEITLPGKSNSYSKNQAALVLQEFFQQNNVKDFKVIHQSESTGSQYCIGNLNTSNGTYRTTIFIKQKGEKLLIQELRFEK